MEDSTALAIVGLAAVGVIGFFMWQNMNKQQTQTPQQPVYVVSGQGHHHNGDWHPV